MKKILLLILILFLHNFAFSIDIETTNIKELNNIFNNKNCDLILIDYFVTCYDYDRKSPSAVYTKIEGKKVSKDGIKKRPSFYTDKRIPKGFESSTSDYRNSGYDRGHFGASDASFDWDENALNSTYKMSNIVPQTPKTNRYKYISLEKYEREMAEKFGSLETISLAFWDNDPETIGKNNIQVPSSFAKIFVSNTGYRECFFIWNDEEYDTVNGKDPKFYEKNCDDIIKMFNKNIGKKIVFNNVNKIELSNLLKLYKKTDLNQEQLNSIKIILKSLQ